MPVGGFSQTKMPWKAQSPSQIALQLLTSSDPASLLGQMPTPANPQVAAPQTTRALANPTMCSSNVGMFCTDGCIRLNPLVAIPKLQFASGAHVSVGFQKEQQQLSEAKTYNAFP